MERSILSKSQDIAMHVAAGLGLGEEDLDFGSYFRKPRAADIN